MKKNSSEYRLWKKKNDEKINPKRIFKKHRANNIRVEKSRYNK